jgi:ferric-dicitrate binding protein FerR (iron transport regulator)
VSVESLALARGELVRLDAACGVKVSVDSGRVWITQESDPRDLWLTAGESVHLDGEGLALLEADRHAHVRIAHCHN